MTKEECICVCEVPAMAYQQGEGPLESKKNPWHPSPAAKIFTSTHTQQPIGGEGGWS